MLQREVSRYIYAQRRIQRWVMVVLGGGLQPPYHPRSHGNPFKLSIEILRRKKEKEEEGERKKKRKESPLTLNPIHMTFGSSCPLRF
jgi:hypothetical protein